MSGLRSDIPRLQSSTYKLSGASLPKTRIYISDTARLQRVTACGRISEPNAVAFTSYYWGEPHLDELAGAFLWYIQWNLRIRDPLGCLIMSPI